MNILLKKYFSGLVGVVCLSTAGLSYASTVDELISHIRQGHDNTALEIINNNDECIHTANAEEKTALIVASRLGKERLAQALIEKRALIDHQDQNRMTALHWAIDSGHTNIALMLIEAGANIELLTCDDQNALIISAKKQNSAILNALLCREATLDQQDCNGMTAVYTAIAYLGYEGRESDCALQLIAAGANTGLAEINRETPLEAAIIEGRLDIVEKIIESETSIDQKSQRDGLTPLQCAIKHDQTKIALMLINGRASLDVQYGEAPLVGALRGGHEELALVLIEAGADVTRTNNGPTPLMLAAQNGQTEVLHKLLKKKVELNEKDRSGKTALDHALQNHQRGAAQILITAGAKTKAALEKTSSKSVDVVQPMEAISSDGDNGHTALMWAIQKGCKESALVLTDAEIDVNLPDNNGRSPLMVAAKAGMLEVVESLLEKGARPKYEIEGNTARDLVCKLRKSKTYPHKKRLFQRIEALLKTWENKQDEQTEPARVNRIVNTDEKSAKHSEHELRVEHTTSGIAPEHSSPKKEPESTDTPAIHALLDDINALAKLLREKPYTLAENGRPLFIDIIIKSIGTKGSAQRYRDILEKLISRTQLLDLLLPTLATTSKSDGGLNLFHAIALLNGNVPHVRALFDSLKAIIIIKDPETNESYVSKEVRAALNQPDTNGRRPLEIATNDQTRAYLCTLGASDTSPLGHPTEAISNDNDEKQDEVSGNADNVQDPQSLFEGLLQAVRGNRGKEIRSLIKWMIAQGLKPMISRQMAGGNTLLHIAVEMNNLEAVKALTGRYDISMLPQARKTTKAKKKRKKKKKQAMDDGLTMQFGFSAKNNDGLTALALAQKALQETAQHSPEHATREAIVRYLASNPAVHQGTLPEELAKSTFSDSVSQFHAAVQVGNVQRVRALLSQESSLTSRKGHNCIANGRPTKQN